MKPSMIAVFALILSGCSTQINSDVFDSGKVDYSKVNANNQKPRAETRLFIKNGRACDYRSTRPESAFAVTIGAFIAKQGVEYIAEYMKAQADYLNGDVKLSGKSLLTIPDKQSYWPIDASVTKIYKGRADTIKIAKNEAIVKYKKTNPSATVSDAGLKKAVDEAGVTAAKLYDEATAKEVELANSEHDLCILIIAGEYLEFGINDAIKTDFVSANKAELARLDEYTASTPSIRPDDDVKPFQGLANDPSMVLELHVIATEKTEKILYTIIPTNLFYPKPLHRGTTNGLERKLTITTKLGGTDSTITLEHIKSGDIYGVGRLSRQFSQFEADKDKRFQDVTVTIIEGPDKMPTAKVLEAGSGKKDEVADYLIEKITEKYGSDEQKAALKK